MSMCARKDASCATQPSSPVRYRSRPVSPTARTRGCAASRSISASAASVAEPAPASFGCTAAAARTFGCRAASCADQREDATSTPTWTSRGTPTATAAAIASSTSASVGSRSSPPTAMSTCVWLSTAGDGSGSGDGGGSPRRLAREDADLLTMPPQWPLWRKGRDRPVRGIAPKWPLWRERRSRLAVRAARAPGLQAGQLLLDDRGVQLGEDRLGRSQRRARRRQRRGRPDRLPLGVAPGDDPVPRARAPVLGPHDPPPAPPEARAPQPAVPLPPPVRQGGAQQTSGLPA